MKNKTEEDVLSAKLKILLNLFASVLYAGVMLFMHYRDVSGINLILIGIAQTLVGVIIPIDARVHIIPNLCLLPMMIDALVYQIVNLHGESLLNAFLAMFTLGIILLTVTSISKMRSYFGAGDIKLISVAGLLLGYSSLMPLFMGMLVSMLIYIVPMMIAKKLNLKSMIAMGPFIGVGIMYATVWPYL